MAGGRTTGEERRDHGQAVPLLAAAVAIGGLAVVGVAELGAAAVQAARARSAADAAALAGVTDGRDGAARLAGANGGTLVAFTRTGEGDVVVVVRVGRARATARATWSWSA